MYADLGSLPVSDCSYAHLKRCLLILIYFLAATAPGTSSIHREERASPSEALAISPRLHSYCPRNQTTSSNLTAEHPPGCSAEEVASRKDSTASPRYGSNQAYPSLNGTSIPRLSKADPPKTRPPRLPLIEDASLYANPQLEGIAAAPSSTTLEELAHLVRLSTYQERKRAHSRLRLQGSLVSTALSARLVRCGELTHRVLVDNFRTDEKKAFAHLYSAIHDVRSSCAALRRYTSLELDTETRKVLHKDQQVSPTPSFLDVIPERSRTCLLTFLNQIRTNPEYLASRITSLSPADFLALTSFHQTMEPINSVLPFHNNRSSSSLRLPANSSSSVERLLSFQRHDPLSAFIYTCFANSAGPESGEDLRRTDIWAGVCARLIQDTKSGTDPFICCVLNVWTAMREWSGRSNMEWYLMKILEDGAFLLEKAEDQAGTRIRVEPRNAKDAIAADDFYVAAVRGLFELVDDAGAGGIPEGMIELGNAILRKLDPKQHAPTRRFLVSKWLFSVFLWNVIIHPEVCEILSGSRSELTRWCSHTV